MNNYLFKYRGVLPFIFICLINLAAASNCIGQNVYITSQVDVDNFASEFPGVSSIQSLSINGHDITNLSGLSQLNKIGSQLSIMSTSLNNLNGLHNLEVIDEFGINDGGIWIILNEELSSLQALENLSYPNENSTVVIGHNKSLEVCNQPFICNYLQEHYNVLIANNGSMCSDRESLLTECGISFDISNKDLILQDGFENWNDTLPNDFEYYLNFYLPNDPSIHKVNSLTEGDFAVSIINNIILLDSPVSPIIYTDIPNTSNKINVEFDCTCIGNGECHIYLIQKENGQNNVFLRRLWTVISGDSTIYTLQFNDVNASSGYDEIIGIGFYTGSDLFFTEEASEFVIDNLKIYEEQSTSTYIHNQGVNLYPNPTSDWLTIKANNDLGKFHLLDANGELLAEYSNQKEINLELYPSGIYFIRFLNENNPISMKIIKQ